MGIPYRNQTSFLTPKTAGRDLTCLLNKEGENDDTRESLRDR